MIVKIDKPIIESQASKLVGKMITAYGVYCILVWIANIVVFGVLGYVVFHFLSKVW